MKILALVVVILLTGCSTVYYAPIEMKNVTIDNSRGNFSNPCAFYVGTTCYYRDGARDRNNPYTK